MRLTPARQTSSRPTVQFCLDLKSLTWEFIARVGHGWGEMWSLWRGLVVSVIIWGSEIVSHPDKVLMNGILDFYHYTVICKPGLRRVLSLDFSIFVAIYSLVASKKISKCVGKLFDFAKRQERLAWRFGYSSPPNGCHDSLKLSSKWKSLWCPNIMNMVVFSKECLFDFSR